MVHVGDSRGYLLEDGEIRQVTVDHSLVQMLVDRGEITPDQARSHPQKNLITRALGASTTVTLSGAPRSNACSSSLWQNRPGSSSCLLRRSSVRSSSILLNPSLCEQVLSDACSRANTRVFQLSTENTAYAGMGTTLVAALILPGAYVRHTTNSQVNPSSGVWVSPSKMRLCRN